MSNKHIDRTIATALFLLALAFTTYAEPEPVREQERIHQQEQERMQTQEQERLRERQQNEERQRIMTTPATAPSQGYSMGHGSPRTGSGAGMPHGGGRGGR